MDRKQFTFYESFASALGRIKSKTTRCDAYDAICSYALYGREPDLDSLPDAAAIAFELIRPTLDTSKRKAQNGLRGGSKAEANDKQTVSKAEANRKQTASEKENEKENEKEGEIEKEKEIENECYKPSVSSPLPPARASRFAPPTSEEAKAYHDEKGFTFPLDAWLSYYETNGWTVNGRKMKDWRASMRYWQSKEQERGGKKPMNQTAQGVETVDMDRLRRMTASYQGEAAE